MSAGEQKLLERGERSCGRGGSKTKSYVNPFTIETSNTAKSHLSFKRCSSINLKVQAMHSTTRGWEESERVSEQTCV